MNLNDSSWSPIQKFRKTKQAFDSFVSGESNGLSSILLKGEGVNWKINWIIIKNQVLIFKSAAKAI